MLIQQKIKNLWSEYETASDERKKSIAYQISFMDKPSAQWRYMHKVIWKGGQYVGQLSYEEKPKVESMEQIQDIFGVKPAM